MNRKKYKTTIRRQRLIQEGGLFGSCKRCLWEDDDTDPGDE